jgi:hypothetical protein
MLRPQFGSEWRTRFEWDSAELRDLEQLRKLGPREPPTAPARPGAAASGDGPQGTVVRTRGAKAAPVAAAGATKAVPKVGPGAAAARPPAPPARPEAPKAEAKPPAAPSTPPPPAVPVPEAKPPAPAPPAPKITQPVAPAGPPAPTPTGVRPVAGPGTAIQRIRLSGSGFELFVSETGAHQLGRAKDEGTLRVDHPTVSRRHARVILADDRGIAYVQDLGGANGTLLNGRPLEKLAPLTEGDRIQIGEVELTVTFERG